MAQWNDPEDRPEEIDEDEAGEILYDSAEATKGRPSTLEDGGQLRGPVRGDDDVDGW